MLVIKRKVTQKGNSWIVTIPKKELEGEIVYMFDEEAINILLNKND